MKQSQILPTALIVLQIGAAIIYWYNKDARHTVYWLAAAVLTAAITF